MKFLSSLVPSILLATSTVPPSSTTPRVTWFIDGNNLMGHKGTPRDRETIATKLKPIQENTSDLSVVLVWDGHRDQSKTLITDEKSGNAAGVVDGSKSAFQVVSLAEGISADDYILEQIKALVESHSSTKVEVVTADRALRRKVLETKPVVRGVVNPVVFWRRYRPRLTGMKSDYKNEPKFPEEEY